jgi:(1->4)-alpha-D-glucan 1-alpha-D-glucosylmutase
MDSIAPAADGVPLIATYRLQLHKEFTLLDATAVVPYLAKLGVSHLYLSPIFTATPGSMHGYDVFDHRTINPEIGGMPGMARLSAAAKSHSMGIIADIVPNHVGLGGGRNPWWRDVLRHGSRSQ